MALCLFRGRSTVGSNLHVFVRLCIAAVLALIVSPSAHAAKKAVSHAHYRVVAIPALSGYADVEPKSVNDKGIVVGNLDPDDIMKSATAFVFQKGKTSLFGLREYDAIDSKNRIAGGTSTALVQVRAAVFDLHGNVKTIDKTPLDQAEYFSRANAITPDGSVLIYRYAPPGTTQTFKPMVRVGAKLRELPTSGIYKLGDPKGGSAGQIVGSVYRFDKYTNIRTRACVWKGGTVTLLPQPPGYTGSDCIGVQANGAYICVAHYVDLAAMDKWVSQMAATSASSMTPVKSYLDGYEIRNGRIEMISKWPGAWRNIHYIPESVSQRGLIVGKAVNGALKTNTRAFAVISGRIVDLNTQIDRRSGWILTDATAVSPRGLIVGTGLYKGHKAAFLLAPGQGVRKAARHTAKPRFDFPTAP